MINTWNIPTKNVMLMAIKFLAMTGSDDTKLLWLSLVDWFNPIDDDGYNTPL